MKLFNTFIAVTVVSAGQKKWESWVDVEGETDKNVLALNVMMVSATTAMNAAVSDPENTQWRVNLRARLDKIRKRSLVDYTERRDTYNCDASEVVTYDEDESEESADFERGLPPACLEAARPFRLMSQQAQSWMNKWNGCGEGPERAGLQARLWKALRLVRKDAYIAVGCEI